jgi:hypothetical protein
MAPHAGAVLAATTAERKRPASGGSQRGPSKVQLRLATEQTFEQYATQRGWEAATLPACPLCAPGTCHFHRLGTYMRKVPSVAYVARYSCPEQHTTFGLLPDFYASRMPGTLDMIEEVAAKAEEAPSVEKAAEEARPADVTDAVTLGAALVWLRLRVAIARTVLTTVKGLMPERFEGLSPRVSAFRRQLGTMRVLVALRGICEHYLHQLSAPLGLVPRPVLGLARRDARAQRPGPDPPPRAR